MQRPRFVPVSTYRLQIHRGFPLTAARDVVPYLRRLGISAVYTSPYFAAEPGSTHGYDITNHNLINPEAGGADAHAAFTTAVRDAGLQHIVDFVPNHMGISTATNPWWRDVLQNGPRARAAHFFDIDWNPGKPELWRKLLIPILGDQYGQVLERGELQLALRDGRIVLRYGDHELPVNLQREPRLQNLSMSSPQQIDDVLRELNGVAGQPRSFDALHELLEEQAYRLAYWRTASYEINYRRFFDVNGLAGLRVEDPDVFRSIHQLLRVLIREERVTGVRIDHPDGLFDPAKYFDRLQDLAADAWGITRAPGSRPLYVIAEKILSGRERLPGDWVVHGTTGYNFLNQVNGLFVNPANARRMRRVYAKLTGESQSLDDLLYESKRLIMNTSLASELSVLAHMLDRITESNRRSRDFTLNSLRDVILAVVASFPVYRTYVTEQGWAPDDRASLERAIVRARRRNAAMDPTIFDFFREVVLPRDPEDVPVSGRDRRGGYPPADADETSARLLFAMKFQQYTSPLQAKGLEDTAFYRYNVLLSLNEVGGDPSGFGVSARDFHELNRIRHEDWPYEMLATSTHDTKLGEDVRVRIDALSEMPDDWGRDVSRWMRLNRGHRTIVDGEPAPDRNDEYRFYQALTGVWPPGAEAASAELVERLQAYMLKAVKESKQHSSWINPNEPYEEAVGAFVRTVLTGAGAAKFLPAFLPFAGRVARSGLVNSLSQVVLKIASPGVPDFYQGSELWDLTLVDPDNRRPVDFAARERSLTDIETVLALPAERRAEEIARLLRDWPGGAIKQLVTKAALTLRADAPELFLEGAYLPLDTESTIPASVIAFARLATAAPAADAPGRAAIVIAPHLVTPALDAAHALPRGDVWKTSRVLLPPALGALAYRDVFTGAEVRPTTSSSGAWLFVGQVLEHLPVSLLMSKQ